MVSAHKVARDTTELGLARLIRMLAVALPSVALIQVLADASEYRQPAAAAAVWIVVLVVGAWFVRRPRASGLAPGETAVAVAVAVAAVAATGAVHRAHGDPGSVDLAVLGTVGLLLLVAMSQPLRVWVPIALLVFAVQGAMLVHEFGLTLLSMSQLGAAGYIIATMLLAFTTLRPTLELHADLAARQASLASRSAAERAAADAVRWERQERLAVLEKEALPLLRGIADGTLDPADAGVREQCARQAAVLRQALAERAPPGGLAARLEQVVRASGARGLPVTVQLIGDPGSPQPPVARAVLAAVDAVLGALAPHQAVLTVLAAGDDIELYLTFDAPLRAAPDLTRCGLDVPVTARWRALLHTTEKGGGFLELGWQREGAV
jgi:hypothetical protein